MWHGLVAKVPAEHLIGEEGAGFKIILTNFNGERLSMSAMALGWARSAVLARLV